MRWTIGIVTARDRERIHESIERLDHEHRLNGRMRIFRGQYEGLGRFRAGQHDLRAALRQLRRQWLDAAVRFVVLRKNHAPESPR